jgi:hypothetical protein
MSDKSRVHTTSAPSAAKPESAIATYVAFVPATGATSATPSRSATTAGRCGARRESARPAAATAKLIATATTVVVDMSWTRSR